MIALTGEYTQKDDCLKNFFLNELGILQMSTNTLLI